MREGRRFAALACFGVRRAKRGHSGEGMAETMTTNTLKDDGYAFVSGQRGLMAGPRLSGDKIARITAK